MREDLKDPFSVYEFCHDKIEDLLKHFYEVYTIFEFEEIISDTVKGLKEALDEKGIKEIKKLSER